MSRSQCQNGKADTNGFSFLFLFFFFGRLQSRAHRADKPLPESQNLSEPRMRRYSDEGENKY